MLTNTAFFFFIWEEESSTGVYHICSNINTKAMLKFYFTCSEDIEYICSVFFLRQSRVCVIQQAGKWRATPWATSFPYVIFTSAISKQAETSCSSVFSMVTVTIKIIYFCLTKERRKECHSINFQLVLQQIYLYPYLHVGGEASVSILLKCTRKNFFTIPELHVYHPPWKYANMIYANLPVFCTNL